MCITHIIPFVPYLKLYKSSYFSYKIGIFQTLLCCLTYVHSQWLKKKFDLLDVFGIESKQVKMHQCRNVFVYRVYNIW